MPRACTICTDPNRKLIDAELVAGKPNRAISRQFRVGRDALRRHKEGHLPASLARAHEAHETASADMLLAQVKSLQQKALSILDTAEKANDLRAAVAAIRAALACVELLAKLLGELAAAPTVNILVAPQWVSLRTVILHELEPYPAARLALAAALEVEESNAGV